jgi:polyisoprenoid-binding protein YceI
MKNTILGLILNGFSLFSIAGNNKDANTITLNATNTTLTWRAEKVTGKHHGKISVAKGNIAVTKGNITGGTIEIDMTSMTCEDLEGEWNQKLIGHLKSDDFFSVEKFKTSNFVIKSTTPLKSDKDGNTHTISGIMTIKGISQNISFPAKISLNGNALSATGTAVIDRSKFDIRYGSKSFFDNLGDKVIYDEFKVEISINTK